MDKEASKYREYEDQARFRDLVQQVNRFLKYAPKGTAAVVLRREAMIFEDRLKHFENQDRSKISKLQAKLRQLTVESSS